MIAPLVLPATHVRGEVLHTDHGYPVRLIATDRPGVLQTKWGHQGDGAVTASQRHVEEPLTSTMSAVRSPTIWSSRPLSSWSVWSSGALVPHAYRPAIRGGLIVSGAVSLIALPLLLGKGRQGDNPSQVPPPYGRNLLLILAVVWGVVALLCFVRAMRARPPHLPHRRRKAGA